MLDSPEGVCAGQARFEYPATFVLFSNIRGVEVLSSNADVDDAGNLTLYKVQCKIAFLVEAAQVGQTPGWDLPTATQT
jgi:hypothetical protein